MIPELTQHSVGVALPYYHIVAGMRHILIGTGNSMGINVGVMLIWIGASFILAWRLIARRDFLDAVNESTTCARTTAVVDQGGP
jgi:hypothetical protein